MPMPGSMLWISVDGSAAIGFLPWTISGLLTVNLDCGWTAVVTGLRVDGLQEMDCG